MVTALVRLLMGCLVMAFLIILLAGCVARPPSEKQMWRAIGVSKNDG